MPWLDYGKTSGPNIHIAHVNSAQVSDGAGFGKSFQSALLARRSLHCSPCRRLKQTDALRHGAEKILEAASPFHVSPFENWSHDGKYIYAEDYADKIDDIVRVNVANAKVEHLLSLKEIPRGFDPWEFWVGLAPDDSPLLMRDKSTQEIYRLDVRFP